MKKILLFMLVLTVALGSVNVGAQEKDDSNPTPTEVNYWYNGIGFKFNLDINNDGKPDWVNKSYTDDFYFSDVDNRNKYLTIGRIVKNDKEVAISDFNNQNSEASIKSAIAIANAISTDSVNLTQYDYKEITNDKSNKMDKCYQLTYTATFNNNTITANSIFYYKYKNSCLYYLKFASNGDINNDDKTLINNVIDSIHFSPYIDVRDVDIKNTDPAEKTLGRNIPEKHWASDVIGKWSDSGVLDGYTDGTFRPDDSLTVVQFTKILCVFFGVNETDLTGNGWDYKTIITGMLNGFLLDDWLPTPNDNKINPDEIPDESLAPIAGLLGVDVESFKHILRESGVDLTDDFPNPEYIQQIVDAAKAPITRAEAITMLAKAFEIPEEEASAELSKFADFNNIKTAYPQYAKLIYAMLNNRYVNGMSADTIGLDGSLTRAQAVKLVDNLTAYYVDSLSEKLEPNANRYILNPDKFLCKFDDKTPKSKFIVFKNGITNGEDIEVDINIPDENYNNYKVICKDKYVTTVYDRGNIIFDASAFGENDKTVSFNFNNEDVILEKIAEMNITDNLYAINHNQAFNYKTTNPGITETDIISSITNVKVNNEICDVSGEFKDGTIKLTLTQAPEQTTPEQTTPEQATPEQATPEQATPEHATPEQATPEQATPEHATPEQATPEQTTP